MTVPAAGSSPLINDQGLAITSLRISVTNRCNEQCVYCRPAATDESPSSRAGTGRAVPAAQGKPAPDAAMPRLGLGSRQELTRAEILGIAGALVQAGARSIRLTGGEPLLRQDLEGIVSDLASLRPSPELRLTTNGLGLARCAEALARAGLDRVNVSLDSVSRTTYKTITGRDALGRVLEGIAAARRAGLQPVRTNTVVCIGLNDRELPEICRAVWNLGGLPRFIELMPMGPLGRSPGKLLDARGIRQRLEDAFGPLSSLGPEQGGGPSHYYETGVGKRFGIIASVTGHICDACDRGRITARGGLQTCLAGPVDADLRAAWHRGGAAEVVRIAAAAVAGKRPREQWPHEAAMVNVGG